jgi:hypothetical protein
VPDATEPTVSSVKPSPRTRDLTPRITARVSDDRDELSQNNVRFFLDGREIATFSYDASTDQLTYQSTRVSAGKHTGRIVAADAAGNDTTWTWTFRVSRP